METFKTNLYVFPELTVTASEPVPEQKPVCVGHLTVEYDSDYVGEKQIQDMLRSWVTQEEENRACN